MSPVGDKKNCHPERAMIVRKTIMRSRRTCFLSGTIPALHHKILRPRMMHHQRGGLQPLRNRHTAAMRPLPRWIVIQVLPQPSLDFGYTHSLALGVVGNLIPVDFTQAEITRFRMSEVKATHARSRPHGKRLRNLHSGIRLNIEPMPERALLGVIR